MHKAAGWILVLAAGVASAAAQPATAAKKSFDVASIKLAAPLDPQKLLSGQQRVGMKMDAGRVDIESVGLTELINLAFKVTPSRVTGPGWTGVGNPLTAQRFDIHATLPAGAAKDDVPQMPQSLLPERVKLGYHRAQKKQPGVALVVGEEGAKPQRS